MKKILLLIFFLPTIGFSQFGFGPKAGITFPSIQENSITGNPDPALSFTVAGFGEYKFSKFAISGELSYSKLQFDKTNSGQNLQFDALNIYILPKFYIVDKLAVSAGPYLSNFLAVKNDFGNVKQFFKPASFGLAAGIEFYCYKGLFFEARYSLGLSNILDVSQMQYLQSGEYDPYIDGTIKLDSKLSLLTVSAGYKF